MEDGFLPSIKKKGKKLKHENYPRVEITSAVYMEEIMNQKNRAVFSLYAHVFYLQQIMTKIRTGSELHLLFIDLAKASDTIMMTKLW